jgi:LysM repeat protein
VKIKVKAPKISAPKSISKAISSVGKTASSVAKGDLKGAAAGVSGLAQAGKDFTKDIGSANLRNITGAFGTLGAATGLSPLEDLAYNVNREGQSGIDQYGDAAIDMAANIGTGGTYGMAQQGINAMAQGGIGGLINPEYIKQGLMSYAASQAGIDPNMLGSVQQLASGDLRGAALQQLGSFGGFDPQQLRTGISALTGDEEGLASGLASQFGANDMVSGMVGQFAGGRGAREVVSDQAGAYAEDEVNQALDRAGVSRGGVRQLQEGVASARQLPTNIIKQAQGQYQIARGDTFNAIANRMGVSPEELRRLNPQIRDINNIAAGARLNLPQSILDLSGKIRPGVVESGQMTQEEFDAARQEGPGFFDQAKNFVGGALGSVKNFAAENKAGLGLGADVLSAGAGYMAGEAGREEAKKLSNQQLAELNRAGAAFEKMQYDPTRYKQEREFIQQRIAGGGITPQEKLLQQQGDIRAARAGAAARLSGMEQQARMGRGATGSGSALAASLAGGQSVMGTQAETNLAREASASQRLEQDIQRQTNLARQQTAEEADLAQQQGTFGLSRATQTGAVRGDLGNLALGRAAALQNLYGSGADFAKQGLSMLESPQQQQPTRPQPARPQPNQAPSLQTRAEAAKRVSNMRPPPRNQIMPAQKPIGQFNQQNAPQPGQGQGYGVLAPVSQAVQQGQQAIGKVQSTVDEAKKKAEEFTKNPLGSLGIKF